MSSLNIKLCNANDLAESSMKEFEVSLGVDDQKAKVLLIKQDNKFHCLAPKCSHYQVPLVNGILFKDRLRCFAHGACFNIHTGDIEDFPGPDSIPRFETYLDSLNDVYLKTTVQELQTARRIKPVKSTQCPGVVSDQSRPFSANLRAYDQLNRSITKLIPKCLIIGSGPAGLLCLDALREAGYSSNITMLTKESYLPYDRPKLSKALNLNINNILLRDEEFFKSNHINYQTNQSVEHIDFDRNQVECSSGRVFDYDKLVIATGLVSAKLPTKPGDHLKGIFTLRSYDDARNIAQFFEQNSADNKKLNIVLVGGSFICMELAAFFADKANTIVMARNKPFETALGAQVSAKIQKLHESKGVKFYINKQFDIVEYKESNERQEELGFVKLKDNSEWPADICVLAIGSKPATDFLKNSPIKLTLNNLVFVDKYMKTNLDNVYAAGDITYYPRACLPGLEFTLSRHNKKLDHVNIGHWGLASQQGRIAGLSIVAESSAESKQKDEWLQSVPFFWSAQHGKNIRFAGYNDNYDTVIFHEDKTKQNELKFAAFYLFQNRVVGVCTLDWDPVCAAFAEAMQNRIEVRKENIENDPIDIKRLLQ